jgi:hypothetical protein
MAMRENKYNISSFFLLLVFTLYLTIRYSHSIIFVHDLSHNDQSNSGLHTSKNFDCKIFHELFLEFTNNTDQVDSIILEFFDLNIYSKAIIISKLFSDGFKARAPPFSF